MTPSPAPRYLVFKHSLLKGKYARLITLDKSDDGTDVLKTLDPVSDQVTNEWPLSSIASVDPNPTDEQAFSVNVISKSNGLSSFFGGTAVQSISFTSEYRAAILSRLVSILCADEPEVTFPFPEVKGNEQEHFFLVGPTYVAYSSSPVASHCASEMRLEISQWSAYGRFTGDSGFFIQGCGETIALRASPLILDQILSLLNTRALRLGILLNWKPQREPSVASFQAATKESYNALLAAARRETKLVTQATDANDRSTQILLSEFNALFDVANESCRMLDTDLVSLTCSPQEPRRLDLLWVDGSSSIYHFPSTVRNAMAACIIDGCSRKNSTDAYRALRVNASTLTSCLCWSSPSSTLVCLEQANLALARLMHVLREPREASALIHACAEFNANTFNTPMFVAHNDANDVLAALVVFGQELLALHQVPLLGLAQVACAMYVLSESFEPEWDFASKREDALASECEEKSLSPRTKSLVDFISMCLGIKVNDDELISMYVLQFLLQVCVRSKAHSKSYIAREVFLSDSMLLRGIHSCLSESRPIACMLGGKLFEAMLVSERDSTPQNIYGGMHDMLSASPAAYRSILEALCQSPSNTARESGARLLNRLTDPRSSTTEKTNEWSIYALESGATLVFLNAFLFRTCLSSELCLMALVRQGHSPTLSFLRRTFPPGLVSTLSHPPLPKDVVASVYNGLSSLETFDYVHPCGTPRSSGLASSATSLPTNFAMLLHAINQDALLPDLVWNATTRRELRAALESEEMELKQSKKSSIPSAQIAWNHGDFQVVYASLASDLRVGDVYVSRVLAAPNPTRLISEIQDPKRLFTELFLSFNSSQGNESLQLMCLDAMRLVYWVHALIIGPFHESLILVRAASLDSMYSAKIQFACVFLLEVLSAHAMSRDVLLNPACVEECVDVLVAHASSHHAEKVAVSAIETLVRLIDARPAIDPVTMKKTRPPPLAWRRLLRDSNLLVLANAFQWSSTAQCAAALLSRLCWGCPELCRKLYLTKVFYHSLASKSFEFRDVAEFLYRSHSEQSYLISDDEERRSSSFLNHLLPESLIHILSEQGPEAFSCVFLNENGAIDTPSCVWNPEMREHLVKCIENYLQEREEGEVGFVPVPPVVYKNLASRVYTGGYYLDRLCDVVRFSDWPIKNPLELLKGAIHLMRSCFSDGKSDEDFSVKMTVHDAFKILGLKAESLQGVNQDPQAVIRRAWRKRALETHPDRHPDKAREEFLNVSKAFEVLSNSAVVLSGEDKKKATFEQGEALILSLKTQALVFRRFADEMAKFRYPVDLLLKVLRTFKAGQEHAADLLFRVFWSSQHNASDAFQNPTEAFEILIATIEGCGQNQSTSLNMLRNVSGLSSLPEHRLTLLSGGFKHRLIKVISDILRDSTLWELKLEAIRLCTRLPELVGEELIPLLTKQLLCFDTTTKLEEFDDKKQNLVLDTCAPSIASNICCLEVCKVIIQSSEVSRHTWSALFTPQLLGILLTNSPLTFLTILLTAKQSPTCLWTQEMRDALTDWCAASTGSAIPRYAQVESRIVVQGVYVSYFIEALSTQSSPTFEEIEPKFAIALAQYIVDSNLLEEKHECIQALGLATRLPSMSASLKQVLCEGDSDLAEKLVSCFANDDFATEWLCRIALACPGAFCKGKGLRAAVLRKAETNLTLLCSIARHAEGAYNLLDIKDPWDADVLLKCCDSSKPEAMMAAQVLASLLADKGSGAIWRERLLRRGLVAGLVDTLDQPSEFVSSLNTSVRLETPTLVWTPSMLALLRESLITGSPLKEDYSEIRGELQIGGVFIRIYLKDPSSVPVTRLPTGWVDALLEEFLREATKQLAESSTGPKGSGGTALITKAARLVDDPKLSPICTAFVAVAKLDPDYALTSASGYVRALIGVIRAAIAIDPEGHIVSGGLRILRLCAVSVPCVNQMIGVRPGEPQDAVSMWLDSSEVLSTQISMEAFKLSLCLPGLEGERMSRGIATLSTLTSSSMPHSNFHRLMRWIEARKADPSLTVHAVEAARSIVRLLKDEGGELVKAYPLYEVWMAKQSHELFELESDELETKLFLDQGPKAVHDRLEAQGRHPVLRDSEEPVRGTVADEKLS